MHGGALGHDEGKIEEFLLDGGRFNSQ